MAKIKSFLDVDPTAELRLICLRRSPQGEGSTQWEVTNSPGILMSKLQYPRKPQEVLNMSSQVNEVVNFLTDFVINKNFQAKIESRTEADDGRKSTEW